MNNNSEYLRDSYHIFGQKAFPLTKHILTLYKKQLWKMLKFLLYKVKIYII